jgi:hypothetical protein
MCRVTRRFSDFLMALWRIESGSYVERNPRPIEDDYINVFPDYYASPVFALIE